MRKPDDDEPVGYRRPPKHTRFKSGQSGNPKGRPKGTLNLKTDLREELGELIRVREANREIRISKQRAFVKSLVSSALKGDARGVNALVSLCLRLLGEEHTPVVTALPINDQKILDAFVERELKRRDASGAVKESKNVEE